MACHKNEPRAQRLRMITFCPDDIDLTRHSHYIGWRTGNATVIVSPDNEIDPSHELGHLQSRLGLQGLIIRYKIPNSKGHQFYSLNPFSLDVTRQSDQTDHEAQLSAIASQLIASDVTNAFHASQEASDSSFVDLDQLNLTDMARACLQKHTAFYASGDARHQNVHTLPNPSWPSRLCATPLRPFTDHSLIDLVALCMLLHMTLWYIADAVQQLDTRIAQLSNMNLQYRNSRNTDIALKQRRECYVALYNTLWLSANDAILGYAIGSLLIENRFLIASYLAAWIRLVAFDRVEQALMWLNAWPFGIRLDHQLGTFFADAFLWFLALSSTVWTDIVPFLPTVIDVVGHVSLFGATHVLACTSDLLSFFTLHLYLFYLVMTSIYAWHLNVIYALFNIFRAKKYNIIKRRVEPATHALEQQVLGTILFILAALVFPSVLAYYLLFAMIRFLLIFCHAAIETAQAFLNHFFLFALMLRVKDPARLPGGLLFRFDATRGDLVLENNPVSVAVIFESFLELLGRLTRHYDPLDMLWKLLGGRPINPIPRQRLKRGQGTT